MLGTSIARIAGALLISAVLLSGCDEPTSSGVHGTVEVTNAGTLTLSRITLTYSGGGSIDATNIVAGGKGVFKQIPMGAVTATGYTATSNPVASATGTLTSSIALLTLNW